MSIRGGIPPAAAMSGLRRGFERFSERLAVDEAIASVEPRGSVRDAVASYVLHRRPIVAGRGLTAAEHVGWRMHLVAGPIAELHIDADRRGYRLAHMESGRLARAFRDVAAGEAPIADLPEADYQLRALFIPGFAVMSAWLHDERAQADVIVPLPGSFYLTVWRAYPPNSALARLREVAATRPVLPLRG